MRARYPPWVQKSQLDDGPNKVFPRHTAAINSLSTGGEPE
jgi:hypothetical protein